MAEYLIRNSLNFRKVVKCSITFRKLTNKGMEAEPVWLIQIATVEPHKDGGSIPPIFIHLVTLDNLNLEISNATEKISSQIDWGVLDEDTRAPLVSILRPYNNMESVDIMSDVVFYIEDLFPATGVDISSIKISVNNMDVTDEVVITGDPYKYMVVWKPFKRVFDYYD